MAEEEITEHDLETRRLQSCLDNWSEASSGDYNPYCCRFPKSCSPHGYIEAVRAGNLTDKDLEPKKESPKIVPERQWAKNPLAPDVFVDQVTIYYVGPHASFCIPVSVSEALYQKMLEEDLFRTDLTESNTHIPTDAVYPLDAMKDAAEWVGRRESWVARST